MAERERDMYIYIYVYIHRVYNQLLTGGAPHKMYQGASCHHSGRAEAHREPCSVDLSESFTVSVQSIDQGQPMHLQTF